MNTYSLTLEQPSSINAVIFGSFSAPKVQEIVVARGHLLELLQPDSETEKLTSLHVTDAFGVVRAITCFRLPGASQDYLVVSSDSGRIVVLQFNAEKRRFDKIHQETYGKSGCRRVVPGQFLAADPMGRAVMLAAVEKQKVVYVMNRDSSAKLTISSPLEAHKSHTLVFDLIGVEVGYDNPIFAALELDYEDADLDPSGEAAEETQKYLTFYQLDLGLNHVIRKWSEITDRRANKLVAVPGGDNGPGGVLVCAENWIIYRNEGHPEVRTAIPRRTGMPMERGLLITAACTFARRGYFFFLLQSEHGDLYKVQLEHAKGHISDLVVRYFDTVSTASGLAITRDGLLFVAAEFGDHTLFRFVSMGDEDEEFVEARAHDESIEATVRIFTPHSLRHLLPIVEEEGTAPITDMIVQDLAADGTAQIYAACGRGRRSAVKVMRHGLAVADIAEAPIPGIPSDIFTVKTSVDQVFDSYIIVSFTNATIVLRIGEGVEEVVDSGFLTTSTTLATGLFADGSLVQVHSTGIRQIKADQVNQWQAPGKKTITRAAVNSRQIAIALSGGEVITFEQDDSGALEEMEKHEIGAEVACIALGEVPEDRRRSRFLAVGCYDSSVRVLSLDPDDYMTQLSMQALPATPDSIVILQGDGALYLNVGLTNGCLFRSSIDEATGELSDVRSRFLGARPVKLRIGWLRGSRSMLALTDRPYLAYNHSNKWTLTPLSCKPLESATGLNVEICPDGIVATHENVMHIMALPKLGETFNQQVIPLVITPRKMAVHGVEKTLCVIQSDHNAFSDAELNAIIAEGIEGGTMDPPGPDEPLDLTLLATVPAAPGKWASALSLIDPRAGVVVESVDYEDNEAAVSLCVAEFHDRGGESFLVVGTVKNLQLHDRTNDGGFLYVYRIIEGRTLQLMHKTPVPDYPQAMCAFQGRLLVGSGKALVLYDLGKLRLLRKCMNNTFPFMVQSVHAMGDRIYVGDAAESFIFAKYNAASNNIVAFADDVLPRFLTASAVLDYDTVAGADKFGNIFVSRLPVAVSDDVDNPAGNRILWDSGYLNAAPHKLDNILNFFIGDVVTTLRKATLVPRVGYECIFYGTICGSIGALLPFKVRDDVDFFAHLEMYMRNELPSLVGRDHLAYRSYYAAVKGVIDGDLCEVYCTLPADKQKSIAEEMERPVGEILKKLEEIRGRVM